MRCATFGFALLAVLLAGCLFSLRTLGQCVNETSQQLRVAHSLALNGELSHAAQTADSARRSWERRETFLGTVLRHDESDALLSLFARLNSYARKNESDEFCAECAELIARLEHIYDMERPLLYNFL